MPKPQWLKDREHDAQRLVRRHDMCSDCLYYGEFVKWSRGKGDKLLEVHECDIHPKCMNTEYSICCDDFASAELV